MSSHSPEQHDNEQPERVYRETRREAIEILIVWAAALVWTIAYCARNAYHVDVDEFQMVLGMPAWVFWGIALPWVISSVFTIWYGLFRMRD